MYKVEAGMPPHARVIIDEPPAGWSRSFFDQQIAQYAADRGAAPRTVTLHPETMTVLGFATSWIHAGETEPARDPLLVSSGDYPRDRITLYE